MSALGQQRAEREGHNANRVFTLSVFTARVRPGNRQPASRTRHDSGKGRNAWLGRSKRPIALPDLGWGSSSGMRSEEGQGRSRAKSSGSLDLDHSITARDTVIEPPGNFTALLSRVNIKIVGQFSSVD